MRRLEGGYPANKRQRIDKGPGVLSHIALSLRTGTADV
jgi:hypothetical protein